MRWIASCNGMREGLRTRIAGCNVAYRLVWTWIVSLHCVAKLVWGLQSQLTLAQNINPHCSKSVQKSCCSGICTSSSSDLCTTNFFFLKRAYLNLMASYGWISFWFGSAHRRILITSSTWFWAKVVTAFRVFIVRTISFQPEVMPFCFSC